MYCILVSGIPASGKSTTAKFLGEYFGIPVISKDELKELMFDEIGFRCRAEKVKLGIASMNIMYHTVEQLMKCKQPFILENNFEYNSREGLSAILEKYLYKAITVTLTGDYRKVYERFVERNNSPDRHPGHITNDVYPKEDENYISTPISFESFSNGIIKRGMVDFAGNGPQIVADTTDFGQFDRMDLVKKIDECRKKILSGSD